MKPRLTTSKIYYKFSKYYLSADLMGRRIPSYLKECCDAIEGYVDEQECFIDGSIKQIWECDQLPSSYQESQINPCWAFALMGCNTLSLYSAGRRSFRRRNMLLSDVSSVFTDWFEHKHHVLQKGAHNNFRSLFQLCVCAELLNNLVLRFKQFP